MNVCLMVRYTYGYVHVYSETSVYALTINNIATGTEFSKSQRSPSQMAKQWLYQDPGIDMDWIALKCGSYI